MVFSPLGRSPCLLALGQFGQGIAGQFRDGRTNALELIEEGRADREDGEQTDHVDLNVHEEGGLLLGRLGGGLGCLFGG